METVLKMFKQAMKTIFVPVHPAGWPFIVGFAVVSVILAMLDESLGVIGLILTAWCLYFFRDPVRVTPQRDGLVISPADGIVSMITKAPLPPELESDDAEDPLYNAKTLTRISVFLNVFDVHVNRNPIAGTVTQAVYHPGKFLNASLDKASVDNERNSLVVKIDDHKSSIAFVQIAGLVARRILCDAKVGDQLKTGEKYGIIRFGSRMDIYLPPRVNPMVSVGQRMIGGETVLADLKSKEKQRIGEVV
jgi:phosphatidylserine decarboxylase